MVEKKIAKFLDLSPMLIFLGLVVILILSIQFQGGISLGFGLIAIWLSAVGYVLHSIVLDHQQYREYMFIIFIIALLYVFIYLLVVEVFMNGNINDKYVFIFHLIAFISVLFSIYFLAMLFVLAENILFGARIGTVKTAGLFIMIWMLPIGIWFIQPKLRQMIRYAGVREPMGTNGVRA